MTEHTDTEKSLNLVIQHAIERRLQYASLHWRTEHVNREAWPHIADAVADAVTPILAARVDAARRDALTEAADEFDQERMPARWGRDGITAWLRARADRAALAVSDPTQPEDA